MMSPIYGKIGDGLCFLNHPYCIKQREPRALCSKWPFFCPKLGIQPRQLVQMPQVARFYSQVVSFYFRKLAHFWNFCNLATVSKAGLFVYPTWGSTITPQCAYCKWQWLILNPKSCRQRNPVFRWCITGDSLERSGRQGVGFPVSSQPLWACGSSPFGTDTARLKSAVWYLCLHKNAIQG